jgi:O-antigen ligase
MVEKFLRSKFNTVIYGAVTTTIVTTPMFNKDSLIIPKVAILFLVALYLIPDLFMNLKTFRLNNISLSLVIVCGLITIQLSLAVLNTDSPIEQVIFGRTGRGLGVITLISLLVFLLASFIYAQLENLNKIINGLLVSGILVSVYALLQYFGLDFFGWVSKTNGIVSFLGNPNFVSSFIAMSFVPTIIFFHKGKHHLIVQFIFGSILLYGLYIAESTQGYINLIISCGSYLLIYLAFSKKILFKICLIVALPILVLAIIGMLNKGPLAIYLYKVSVQSRGDFWRSAVNTIDANPIFGIGPDSFGDYFLKFRDEIAVSHPWAEYADSAHNYFLDYALNGGIALSLLYFSFLIFIFRALITFYRNNEFDPRIASLYSSLAVYYAQSIISPMNIGLMVWGSVITGALIGLSVNKLDQPRILLNTSKSLNYTNLTKPGLLLIGLILIYPYFNSDRQQLIAMNSGNGDLAIKSAKMYPESTVRYFTLSQALLDSGLNVQSLDLAKSAVSFNPNSAALWSLILINPNAPISDRVKAKSEILKLDPLNKQVRDYLVSGN